MTAAKKNQPAPSVLDSPWRYGYVSRPILWALTVWAAAVAVHAVDLKPWTVAAAGAGLAILAAIATPARYKLFAFTLGAAVGGYLTWTSTGSPFTRGAALWLIPGAAVLGVWWHLIGQLLDIEAEQAAEEEAKAEKAAEDGNLIQILANAGFRSIKAGGPVEHFAAGRTQKLVLPANGSVTFKRLHADTEKIEIAARSKFPIRFVPGDTAAEVLAVMLDRDVLAETIPYPVERAARSINDPMPLGMDELGVVKVVTFRELSAMYVGERGSGKSGLVNANLAYMTGCSDALVWMIDGKGGRTALPWLQPFLDGIGKPAIDWCATTPEEAQWVLTAARAVIDYRSRPNVDRKDPEKVTPTPAQPAVIVIVEEASLITGIANGGNAARAEEARQGVVLGRSEAVDFVFMTQRGTVSMLGSGDMKSQLQLVIGLGISKMEDAVRIFADSAMAREVLRYADDLRYLGVMLVKSRGWKSVLPIKGFWLAPRDIPGVAQTNALHRPDLEAGAVAKVEQVLSQAGCKGGYAGRWERFFETVGGGLRETPAGVSHGGVSNAPGVSQTVSHEPAPGVSQSGVSNTGETPPMTRAEQMVAEAKAAQRARFEEAAFKRIAEAEWDTDGEGWRETPDETPGETPRETAGETPEVELTWNPEVIPPFLGLLMSLFCAESVDTLPTKYILEQAAFQTLTSKRLATLAAHCGFTPIENAVDADGNRARGYAWIDVTKAFARARDTGAPAEAFRWSP